MQRMQPFPAPPVALIWKGPWLLEVGMKCLCLVLLASVLFPLFCLDSQSPPPAIVSRPLFFPRISKAQSAEHKGPSPTSSLTSPLSLLAMGGLGKESWAQGSRSGEQSELGGRSHSYFLVDRLLYPYWNVSPIPAKVVCLHHSLP